VSVPQRCFRGRTPTLVIVPSVSACVFCSDAMFVTLSELGVWLQDPVMLTVGATFAFATTLIAIRSRKQ